MISEFSLVEAAINLTPIALLALGIFLLMALAALVGHLSRRFRGRAGGELFASDQESHIIGAALAMLGLLLGFTFSMAVDRFDQRRSMVVQEANAISATYLMAQTFGQPHRADISRIVGEYLDNRLAAATSRDVKRTGELLHVGEGLKTRLWAASLSAVAAQRDDVSSSYLQSAHEMIEIGAGREASRRGRIPPRVHVILLVIAMTTAGILGFVLGGAPRYVEMGILLLLVTVVMTLIVDLDRPSSGTITESQLAMEQLKLRIERSPPAAFDSAEP